MIQYVYNTITHKWFLFHRDKKHYFLLLISKNINYLKPALDEIEGSDGGVSDTAGQDSAERAQGEVLVGAELAAELLGSSSGQLSALDS